MSFSGWIKRKSHFAAPVGISSIKVNQKQSNIFSFLFTLTNSVTLETNAIALPSGVGIKNVDVIQKSQGKDRISFEITFSNDKKIETSPFLFIPVKQPSTETTMLVAKPENILLATSLGLDYGSGQRFYMCIPWNKDVYWTSKAVELNQFKDEIVVKQTGILSVFVALYLKVKMNPDVRTIQLKIVKKTGEVLGMTIIKLPSGKAGDDVSFDAGGFRFTNLALEAQQSFGVLLQCSERIYVAVNMWTTLEVMWYPPVSH